MFSVSFPVAIMISLFAGVVLGFLFRSRALFVISVLAAIAVATFIFFQPNGEYRGWAYILYAPCLGAFLLSLWATFIGRNISVSFTRPKKDLKK
ncbi:MAG: hypothetical protein Q7S28_03080 [bacterium]|nr:hypothetical protein [bacterium]